MKIVQTNSKLSHPMFLCNPNSVAGQKIAQITLPRKTDFFTFQWPKIHQKYNFITTYRKHTNSTKARG